MKKLLAALLAKSTKRRSKRIYIERSESDLDEESQEKYPTKDGYYLTAIGFYHKSLDDEGEGLMSFFMIL